MTDRTFLTTVDRYLRENEAAFAAVTVRTKRSALRTVAHDLASLNIPKPATPRRLGREHVLGLLAAWRGRGLALSSQHKLLADLEGLLVSLGNPVIAKMRREPGGRRMFPGNKPMAIKTLGDDELDRLRTAAASMDGWHGNVARVLVGALPYTGLRPKEVRLAKLADVDLAKGLMLVSSPKGQGTWAAPDFARIPPVARQAFADYLAERAEYLAGEESGWLIPLRGLHSADAQEPTVSQCSEDWLRHLKREVQERSGVQFRGWKVMRATFCQRAIDGGARIDAVSKAMRHGSTTVTETYYGRIRTEQTYAEIDRAFEQPPVSERVSKR